MDRQRAENLERAVEKTRQLLAAAAEDVMTACLSARSLPSVPRDLVEGVLKDYDAMQVRLAEVRSVQEFLLRRFGRALPDDPLLLQLMADLDVMIHGLVAHPPRTAPAAAPSERWLGIEDNSLSFTINARLLDELEYGPLKPGEARRAVERTGRGFTLFTLRGPASSLDEVMPCFKLRQHDIVERFSATEIRGVLTHLRQTTVADVRHIFDRLIACRFADVTCVLADLQTPDQLDDGFLKELDRMTAEMRPGEVRAFDIEDRRKTGQ